LSPQGRWKARARRTCVRAVDNYLLTRVSKRFVQSETIRARLRRFNGLDADVLHPPAPPRAYRCDGYGDYLFFASRLTPLKRADLLLQAMARPEASGVRCVIGGDGEQRAELVALAARLGLTDRVTFEGRLDDDALVAHLGRCRAVVFPPKDEDYGFVTIEAFVSGKAVITTTDSGGPLDLVKDGQNGLIVEPTADALAAAIARVMDSPSDAERMGQQARRDAAPITWPATVAKLTEN
jgi:glycosyltransferase involved in cell wall biosynthesis